MKPRQKVKDVFYRYLNNKCSPEEISLLFQYFDAKENEKFLKELIRKELNTTETNDNKDCNETKSKLADIFSSIKKKM